VKDFRNSERGNLSHPLLDIMFLVISGVVSGANDWVTIEIFGKGQLDWLRQFLPFKNGIPSHDTLGRVFASLDSDEFGKCFIEWIAQVNKITNGEVVAVDGKCIRGSYDKGDKKSAIHMVSAYATESRLSLGQIATDIKSNEITAIPKLLDILSLKGCTVTIDAMGCQKKIAQKILDSDANYILGLKENQKILLEQVQAVFTNTKSTSQAKSYDVDHGRVEQRKCTVIQDLHFIDDVEKWPGLKSVVRIESERYFKITGKVETSTRYYISSLSEDAKVINKKIRDHWGVENKLHWILDVVFKEDSSRRRKGNSAINFNIIAKIALSLIEKTEIKLPRTQKRNRAAYDPKFREKILGV
jgi:predicted transposase YbfD/YdcC